MNKTFDSMEVSLFDLARKKKKKQQDEWIQRAESGEQMRII